MPFTPTSAEPIRPTAVGQTGNLQILQRLVDGLSELRGAGLLIGNDLGTGGGGGSASPTSIFADSAGAYPLRNTVVTSTSVSATWVGPTPPPTDAGYAISIDQWDNRKGLVA